MKKSYGLSFILLVHICLFANDINFIIQPFGWEEKNGQAVINVIDYISAVESACTVLPDEILFSKENLAYLDGNNYLLNGEYVLDLTYAVEHLPLNELENTYSFFLDGISIVFIIVNENLNRLYYEFDVIPYDYDAFPKNRSIPNKTLLFYPSDKDNIFSIADARVTLENDHVLFDQLYTITDTLRFNFYSGYNIDDREKESYVLGERIGIANGSLLQVLMVPCFSRNNILPVLIYKEDIKNDISDVIINFHAKNIGGHNQIIVKEDIKEEKPTSFGIVNDSRVRIRNEPNLESSTIGYLDKGDIVFILEATAKAMVIDDMQSVWFKIENEDDLVGWSFGYFIDVMVK